MRRNNALEELVEAFKEARGKVLEVARGWRGFEDQVVDGDAMEEEGPRGEGRKGRRVGKKRKAEEAGMNEDDGEFESEDGEDEENHVMERPRSGAKTRTRTTRTRTRTRSQRARARASAGEKDEDASQETNGWSSEAERNLCGPGGSFGVPLTDLEDAERERPSRKSKMSAFSIAAAVGIDLSKLVSCPICGRRMLVEAVDPHLDKCIVETSNPTEKPSRVITSLPTGPSHSSGNARSPLPNRSAQPPSSKATRTTSSSSSLKKPQQQQPPQQQSRLAQLNHSLLRDRQLRQKLSELGIPDWGTRALLIRRHTEWVNLHNANCDALRPRSKRELLKDLDAWERTLGGLAPSAASTAATAATSINGGLSGGGTVGMGGGGNNSGINGGESGKCNVVGATAVMRKDFDGKGWARRNREEFDGLIAAARRSRERRAVDGTDNANGVKGTDHDGTDTGTSATHSATASVPAPAPASASASASASADSDNTPAFTPTAPANPAPPLSQTTPTQQPAQQSPPTSTRQDAPSPTPNSNTKPQPKPHQPEIIDLDNTEPPRHPSPQEA